MAKLLVSEKVKRAFDRGHAGMPDAPSKKNLATELVRDGLNRLKKNEPPGKPVRAIPAANGSKAIEYDDKGLKRDLQQFKGSKEYDRLTTAVRACFYSGLKVPIREWKD